MIQAIFLSHVNSNIGILIGFLILAILISIIARSRDSDRIKKDIESKGGTLISKERAPFGKGWIGERNDRIYKVVYLDKDGNKHQAFVKTSSGSSVYYSSDEIIEYSNVTNSSTQIVNDLMLENDRLRREIEQLKNKDL